MKEFLHSRRLKVLLGIIVFLLLGMLIAASTKGSTAPVSTVSEFILAPFQRGAAWISDTAKDLAGVFVSADDYKKQISDLQDEISALKEQLVDHEKIKQQNEQYEKYLQLKDEDYKPQFVPAEILSRDANDIFHSFGISKGSLDGVKVNDPVVYGNYLVGVVTEVHPIYSKVSTILNPNTNASAYEIRTRETGVIGGSIELAAQGLCRMSYLKEGKGTAISVGGIVCTAGTGGVYPPRLIIGTVTEIKTDASDIAPFAVIRPEVDVSELRDVFVITWFEKQGVGIETKEEDTSAAESTIPSAADASLPSENESTEPASDR